MNGNAEPEIILPPGAEWRPGFDVEQAVAAYIATVPAGKRTKSDAYFEGGYWVDFFGALITVVLALLLLGTRLSAWLRDRAGRHARRTNLRVLLYALAYLFLMSVLTLPWTLYTDYWREHAYGMSNYAPGLFLRDWAIGTVVNMLLLGVALAGLYAILRRVGRGWVAWATSAVFAFLLFIQLIFPMFLAPLFNDYQALPEGPVRKSILALARDNDIPAEEVYWFDASKQTRRISANVAGIGGTMRIALNDNLLNGTTLPEIRAVMAHEMGHYVKHHSFWLPLAFAIVVGAGLLVVDRGFSALVRRYGERWDVRGLADPAGLPLVVAILAVTLYLLTPVTNNVVRLAENQADAFGLEAAREPYGFASAAMRISDYRKLEPSALEEFLFFDHPSGRSRVTRAMRWLAENPPD